MQKPSFGAKIEQLVETYGFDGRALLRRTGMERAELSEILANRRMPTLDQLWRVAKAFRVEVALVPGKPDRTWRTSIPCPSGPRGS